MDNDQRPEWAHKVGDTYRVIIASAWMNGSSSGINYYPQPTEHRTLAKAIAEGFTEHDRSDDFNVGAYRNGDLKALLWMGEIVDDEPSVLAEMGLTG